MRAAPPLFTAPRYPVTAAVAVAAIAATASARFGSDITFLQMGCEAFRKQPWQPFTSCLPHVDLFHLLFNIYWLWVFGTLIEDVYGWWRMAGLVLILAVFSSAAEWALFDGGVGLSGVGYGLFALTWVLSRRHPRFASAMDGKTVAIFVAWFFLCVALTRAGLWTVGNVAHGAGALLGAVTGIAVLSQGWRRMAIAGAAVALGCVAIWGGAEGWQYVNHGTILAPRLEYEGYLALESGNLDRAERLHRKALAIRESARTWWNLGVVYVRRQRWDEAFRAFEEAHKLEPANPEYEDKVKETRDYLEAQKGLRFKR